jgi:arylformamidase
VHRALLAAGVIVVENLALACVASGAYELTCLPLPIAGCDGAPARVVLLTIDE